MSKLSEILAKLGFETREKQIAFVENLYFAGYFQDEKIWQMLNLMRCNKDGEVNCNKERDINKDFFFIREAINEANANQDDFHLFNPKILLDNLFNQEELFDGQDIEDMVLYMAQTAFARVENQERSELKKVNRAEKYQAQYIANAKILQLFDAIEPKAEEEFDETWVQGAARSRVLTRLQHAKELQDGGIKTGTIRLLTGEREMWVEIDSIDGNFEECKQYMLKLAQENGLKINEQDPFIKKFVAGTERTYLNYDPTENKKLTESMMAEDLYRQVFGVEISKLTLVDSAPEQDKMRPDTIKNAQDVAKESLRQRLDKQGDLFAKDEVKIAIVSNQPYAVRQALSIQRGVLKVLGDEKKISFNPIGKECEVGVSAIHSELGALVAEQYMLLQEKDKVAAKTPLDNILFSKRCNDVKFCPPMPPRTAVENPETVKMQISQPQKSQ